MKIFRPGLPAVFTDEDAINQPAPPKVAKPNTAANPFLTPEEAIKAAAARHAASQPLPAKPPLTAAEQTALDLAHAALNGSLPQGPSPNPGASGAPATTQIIPPVAPQPLIDNNKPPATPPVATTQPEPEVNTSPELTPEEEAELDLLLAKRDHTQPHQEPPTS